MVKAAGGASPDGAAEGAGSQRSGSQRSGSQYSESQYSGLLRPGMLFASAWPIPVVLGAVLGTVGWLISGWPWWPPVGAAALWAAAFLVPRYWPGLRADRWSLRTELLLMFAARKGVARMRAEQERRFRRAGFPIYGLPASFPGERYLVASGTSGSWRRPNAVRWLSLGHGDPRPYPGGTWLIVETALTRCAPPDAVRQRRLAERLRNLEQWAAIIKGDRPPQGRPPIMQRPDPHWSAARIAIDDVPVAVEYLADGERWAAWAPHGDLVLSLLASRISLESVTLTSVIDLQRYIDGSRRRDAAPACTVAPPQDTPAPHEDGNETDHHAEP